MNFYQRAIPAPFQCRKENSQTAKKDLHMNSAPTSTPAPDRLQPLLMLLLAMDLF